jgi:hypothetical protein
MLEARKLGRADVEKEKVALPRLLFESTQRGWPAGMQSSDVNECLDGEEGAPHAMTCLIQFEEHEVGLPSAWSCSVAGAGCLVTMSPNGVTPHVLAVAPLPIWSASARRGHGRSRARRTRPRPRSVARADEADGGHDGCSSVESGSVGLRGSCLA